VVTGGSFAKKMHSFEPEQVDLVIGTVGMLGKFFFNEAYDTSQVRYVVFDEADTLVDESFQWRTTKIMENFFSKDRAPGVETKLCFVGATVPHDLQTVCNDYIPVSISSIF
jgi:superfamily II DNA/RNA helicase